MKYSELTEKIIKAAYTVHNALGFGFLEKVYAKCIGNRIKKNGTGYWD